MKIAVIGKQQKVDFEDDYESRVFANRLVPLIFSVFISMIAWSVINRINTESDPVLFFLVLGIAFFVPLFGLGLLFGLTKSIRKSAEVVKINFDENLISAGDKIYKLNDTRIRYFPRDVYFGGRTLSLYRGKIINIQMYKDDESYEFSIKEDTFSDLSKYLLTEFNYEFELELFEQKRGMLENLTALLVFVMVVFTVFIGGFYLQQTIIKQQEVEQALLADRLAEQAQSQALSTSIKMSYKNNTIYLKNISPGEIIIDDLSCNSVYYFYDRPLTEAFPTKVDLIKDFQWGGVLEFGEEVEIPVENGENIERCRTDFVCSQTERVTCDVALDTSIEPGRVDTSYEFYVGKIVGF